MANVVWLVMVVNDHWSWSVGHSHCPNAPLHLQVPEGYLYKGQVQSCQGSSKHFLLLRLLLLLHLDNCESVAKHSGLVNDHPKEKLNRFEELMKRMESLKLEKVILERSQRQKCEGGNLEKQLKKVKVQFAEMESRLGEMEDGGDAEQPEADSPAEEEQNLRVAWDCSTILQFLSEAKVKDIEKVKKVKHTAG